MLLIFGHITGSIEALPPDRWSIQILTRIRTQEVLILILFMMTEVETLAELPVYMD